MPNDDKAQQQSPPPPSDEEIGQALLEAARYGDLEDLQELTQTYGKEHLNFRGGGDNTCLHYGMYTHVDIAAVRTPPLFTFSQYFSVPLIPPHPTPTHQHSFCQWPH